MEDHRSNNGRGTGPIPKRWLNCPRNSSSFIADKFLAFKTPLSARFASQMEIQQQFQPDMVFSYIKMCKVVVRITHFRSLSCENSLNPKQTHRNLKVIEFSWKYCCYFKGKTGTVDRLDEHKKVLRSQRNRTERLPIYKIAMPWPWWDAIGWTDDVLYRYRG